MMAHCVAAKTHSRCTGVPAVNTYSAHLMTLVTSLSSDERLTCTAMVVGAKHTRLIRDARKASGESREVLVRPMAAERRGRVAGCTLYFGHAVSVMRDLMWSESAYYTVSSRTVPCVDVFFVWMPRGRLFLISFLNVKSIIFCLRTPDTPVSIVFLY